MKSTPGGFRIRIPVADAVTIVPRVTSLGEFSPIRQFFSLGYLFKYTMSSNCRVSILHGKIVNNF
jgi:hypothetical protein